MPKLALAFLLSLSLLFPARTTRLEDSIKPLAWTTQQTDMFDEPMGPPKVGNHCTTWAYHSPANPSVTHWITAAHCILDEDTGAYEGNDYQIGGKRVYPEYWLWPTDIASLSGTGVDAPGLVLADRQPGVEEFVKGAGHPYGLPFMVTVRGSVAALDAHFIEDPTGVLYNIFELPVAPGNSGGPIMDKDDHVVGLTQIGFSGYSVMSGGLSLSQIRAFLADLP